MNNTDRKYPTLTAIFMRGTLKGQITAIYKGRETRPDRVADFQRAIAAKDIVVRSHQLTPAILTMATELGILVK